MDQQRSDEWFEARLGKITASSVNKLITSQGKPSTQAQGYINQLIAEAVTGERPEQHTTEAMERGIAMEPQAVAWYELATGYEVEETGFHVHPDIACGASPDGLIGSEGIIEIKTPLMHNHVATIRANRVPAQYVGQIQMQLWVTGRSWADFLSYSDKLPPVIIRVQRDNDFIDLMAEQVKKAADTIQKEVKRIKEMV